MKVTRSPRAVRRLLVLSWHYRWTCVLAFLGQAVSLALGLGALGASGLVVDVVRRALEPTAPEVRWPLGLSPPAGASSLSVLAAVAGVALALAAARAAVAYGTAITVGRLIHLDIVPELRTRVFDKLLRLDLRFFDKSASGAIINRVTGDVQSVRSFVDGVLLQGAVLLLTLAVYVAYMLRVSPGLTVACLAPTPIVLLATIRFSRWARPAYEKSRALADEMVLAFSEGVKGIRVTKIFGTEAHAEARFRTRNRAVRDQQEEIFLRVSRLGPTVSFVTALDVAVLLLYGGFLVARARVTLGQLVVFAGLLQQFAAQISATATILNTLEQSVIAARRVFEVLDAPVAVATPADPRRLGTAGFDIAFEAVDLEHTPGRPALRGIDLAIPAGQCLGITGATGAGKTTLLNLLSRFFDPTRGRVTLGGVDLRDLDVGELRRQVGVVFQETFLFRGTIAENIAFSHPEVGRQAIERAAQVAGAHGFIAELPGGYDTMLEEGGGNLSGGQRQRLAIARALLLDPPLLLLDDPTSAVDPQTEDEMLAAIESARHGRTTLLVTHRLKALREADAIAVLHGGQIVEVGTHAELVAAGGRYARVVAVDASEQAQEEAPT